MRGHGAAADRAAQLPAPGGGPGVRRPRSTASPPDWSPLSVVAPITEASAEYQAIAYALDTPGVELVLVDRSVGPRLPVGRRGDAEPTDPARRRTRPPAEEEAGAARRRGRRGDRRPAAALRRAGGAPAAPRPGAALVGVVAPVRRTAARRQRPRHLPAGDAPDRQPVPAAGARRRATGSRVDEDRERYMWTRMREHLAATGTDPARLPLRLRRVPRGQPGRGVRRRRHRHLRDQPAQREQVAARPDPVQPRGDRGAVRPRRRLGVDRRDRVGEEPQAHPGASRSGSRGRRARRSRRRPKAAAARPPAAHRRPARRTSSPASCSARPSSTGSTRPNCSAGRVEIVRAARRNGYLASTADAIAVFETSILLAGMRDRARPTPYDFQDAAVTCIEKDTVPGRRDVRRLVRDHDGRRPDRPGRLRRAAAAGPRRARPARAAGPEPAAARRAAGAARHRRRGRSWGRAPTCCGCCAT